jgi:hypothetical protein
MLRCVGLLCLFICFTATSRVQPGHGKVRLPALTEHPFQLHPAHSLTGIQTYIRQLRNNTAISSSFSVCHRYTCFERCFAAGGSQRACLGPIPV